jgi:SAM-dependent methyltransferase
VATSVKERVETLRPWHYQFNLDGVRTPVWREDAINRHPERKRMGFDPLVRVSQMQGKRVLDLGCNSGWWSLAALNAGAGFVLGIDGRQLHIDQANLVFETEGADPSRYRFELGNIFEHELGSFDVVLCLGLMYHIAKPLELFELFSRVGASYVLIDTVVSLIPVPAFRVQRETLGDPRNAVDYETTLIPSRDAVRFLAAQFGYQCVSLAPNAQDWTGMQDYKNRTRAMFLCSRGSVEVEVEDFSRIDLAKTLARRVVKRNLKRAGRPSGKQRARLFR